MIIQLHGLISQMIIKIEYKGLYMVTITNECGEASVFPSMIDGAALFIRMNTKMGQI